MKAKISQINFNVNRSEYNMKQLKYYDIYKYIHIYIYITMNDISMYDKEMLFSTVSELFWEYGVKFN